MQLRGWAATSLLVLGSCGDGGEGGGGADGGPAGGAAPLGCGDAFADPDLGEECDDGNGEDADDCLNDCTLPKCGDGTVHLGFEECDDGNLEETDDCTSGCVAAACGDGVTHAGVEACDDGNEEDGDACSSACTAGSGCGNGATEAGEDCDDGNTDNSDDCTNDCTAAECGDGYAELGVEDCDDGNAVDDDACSNECVVNIPVDFGCPGIDVALEAQTDVTLGGDTSLSLPGYAGSCGGGDAPEYVYAITPEASGLLMLEMIAIYDDLDPILYVKTDCESASTIACADSTFIGGYESLGIAVTGGDTYYVFADGYDITAGEFLLGATLLTSVPGDDCPGVNIPISDFNDPYSVSGDTSAANADRQGTGLCASSATPEIVYRVTPPDNGKLVVAVDPSYDASVYIRSSCTSQASQLVCAEDGLAGDLEVAQVNVVAGNTYYVFIDGWDGDAGSYNVEFTLIP
jgi:cysteine-rich repeat protein